MLTFCYLHRQLVLGRVSGILNSVRDSTSARSWQQFKERRHKPLYKKYSKDKSTPAIDNQTSNSELAYWHYGPLGWQVNWSHRWIFSRRPQIARGVLSAYQRDEGCVKLNISHEMVWHLLVCWLKVGLLGAILRSMAFPGVAIWRKINTAGRIQ